MTHQVFNQPPPLVDHDVAADPALPPDLLDDDVVRQLGRRAGSAEVQRWAEEANAYPPRLRTHDRYGNRADEVDFHPSWHRLMEVAVGAGLAGAERDERRRAAGLYVWSQAEAGHTCPISMTYAIIPALRHQPDLAVLYEPLLTSRIYDPELRAPATKRGLLAGMGMTEKQGGSDVRANTTTATRNGDHWLLTGHKWFTSAPMCDLFLVLAQAPRGLSCFLVPRVLPDGSRNVFRIQRLKDKLGNRSNASSEPEFDDTVAWLVGEEGRGVRTIIEMVAMTRLDCVIGSAAGMRAALVQAIHHARHREAFGRRLVDQPLMTAVLADMALETEAATALMLRLAGSAEPLRRLAIAVGKFWVCKRQTAVVGEALECLGGNGYVEESGLPRLYRDAPLNSIWEGSGNVQALDVLRTLRREPDSAAAFLDEVALAGGADRRLDEALTGLKALITGTDEAQARRVTERMALVLQGSLLVRHAPPVVADAFCASRLGGDHGRTFGTLPPGVDTAAIVDRAAPPAGRGAPSSKPS
ncbi:acyl-CoA dehydrogenase family protein [Actinoplanes sp. NPDC051633]|uniref:acyl-CoA dehydrogenase family protein n=1 Tax=Actinoplanes sp. NPDC051633 TaxID=3155670 RepID=UPI003448547E